MRLAISNIAWHDQDNDPVESLLREHCDGVEIAPTRLWPSWENATEASALTWRTHFDAAGLAVPALQSILYEVPGVALFGTTQEQTRLHDHLLHVASLASALGAGVLVFGSPRQRDPGTLSGAAALDKACEFFGRIAPRLHSFGVTLGIEANPSEYGCRFLTTTAEAAACVSLVDAPGIGLHVDTGGMALSEEDSAVLTDPRTPLPVHLHLSMPHLAAFRDVTSWHRDILDALDQRGYEGWASIEMRAGDTPVHDVHTALLTAKELMTP